MPKRKRLKTQKEHMDTGTLLDLLKAGAVLAVALTAPNALRFIGPLVRKKEEWDHYYPSSIERSTLRLWRKGLVDVREDKKGYTVVISDKGKAEVLRYDVETMEIPKQDPWDGMWRMIFFDIPAGEKARHVFREQLKTLGFFPMQESVYVYPYPCYKQIRFLREVYGIPHDVKLATVHWLENDEDLRNYFQLNRRPNHLG